jgi:hypothetical protein
MEEVVSTGGAEEGREQETVEVKVQITREEQ